MGDERKGTGALSDLIVDQQHFTRCERRRRGRSRGQAVRVARRRQAHRHRRGITEESEESENAVVADAWVVGVVIDHMAVGEDRKRVGHIVG
ncbi:hypothetical protein GOSPT_022_01230 [Gordonia sputi NBRC 100414]|uniref:Uncharacterized protein n=1 Tax=Gordonia sputi NBRC 100414 TaxID=1089453 RepID=H5TWC1_9ACTN|nr:hypothetical protein GOSPT_022_01230 [Gordonia sputi NBRC 100414]